MVRRAVAEFRQPMVVDADALNALAGTDWSGGGRLRVLTPHPGEMARLTREENSGSPGRSRWAPRAGWPPRGRSAWC